VQGEKFEIVASRDCNRRCLPGRTRFDSGSSFGAVKKSVSDRPLLAGASVDRAAIQVVQRSCQNCHSERTDWPWYSYVAPASWLIERDVQQGRSHMNLSHWDQYCVEKREDILVEISAMIRSRQMPPSRYLRLHPDAKLSDEEIDLIYKWARAERKRLKSEKP
jgi:hypothetical protein